MVFTLSGWMLYSMWIVLGLMALDFLAGLYQSLKTGKFSYKMILGKLQDMLYYVFPLFLLANIMSLDSTGWSLVLIGYYIGAIGVALKYVFDIKSKL